jgi:hypothetical protein
MKIGIRAEDKSRWERRVPLVLQDIAERRRLMDVEATLIDYERVVDEQNRRLIFFGRHAGLAGMVNTL